MWLEYLEFQSASFRTGIQGSYHISGNTSLKGTCWGPVYYIVLQSIHKQMANQKRHNRSLNRYYVVMHTHAQIPGMNIYCFVTCALTVMPAAAPICHST